MKQNEIEQLINLRNFLINKYKSLDGASNPATSVILQKDVAYTLEESIKKLDVILSSHVTIRK